MEFKTEVKELLSLMIHSLYSNKEIFLRELVSNSSDALDKLKFLSISDDKYKNITFDPQIKISVNKELKTLTIEDNGIGMDEDDLNNNLGTIAKSGTKKFIESMGENAKKNSELIGQFGVGFYSAFMVASKIEVLTKKVLDDKAYLWSSDAATYEISSADKDSFGTKITLYLNDDEFLDEYRLENIIKKYSNHIHFPIFLNKKVYEEKKEGEENKEDKYEFSQVNKAKALWRMDKKDIKDEEYNEFYKSLSYDYSDPFLHIHTKAEGAIEYTSLFYVPSVAPFDLYRADYEGGIKLYVKRVFISDNEKILPPYLRFIKGVLDVEDLPLNVSREILQENKIMANVKSASEKKILAELLKLKQKDKEKYLKFYAIFGKVLKEGLYGFGGEKEGILKLLFFKSTLNDELIDLDEYKNHIKDDCIYYLCGKDYEKLKNSPLLESFKKDGKVVLLMDDEVDTIVMPMAGEYGGVKFKSISEVEFKDDQKEQDDETNKEIFAKIKTALDGKVKDVRSTKRLSDSLSCLVFDAGDPDFAMQQIMKQMGQQTSDILPILEINTEHKAYKKLCEDEKLLDNLSQVAYGTAVLSQGMDVKNPHEFNKAVLELINLI